MATFVLRYGFAAILVGTAVEGEPVAVAGGMLAQREMLSLWVAVGAAFAGGCLIDQAWFHLARRVRTNRLVRNVANRPAFARALGNLEKHPNWFVLLARFAYGVRAAAAVAIGLSAIRTRVFLPLNVLAAAFWSACFTGLGFLSGPMFEQLWKRYGAAAGLVAVLVYVIIFAVILRHCRSGHERAAQVALSKK